MYQPAATSRRVRSPPGDRRGWGRVMGARREARERRLGLMGATSWHRPPRAASRGVSRRVATLDTPRTARVYSLASRALSSAGRALARQARGHWFKSSSAHHLRRAVTADSQVPRIESAMSMASISEDRPDVVHYPGGEALYRLRHSAAHVLATAVTELFPDVKVAGGPPIENGF